MSMKIKWDLIKEVFERISSCGLAPVITREDVALVLKFESNPIKVLKIYIYGYDNKFQFCWGLIEKDYTTIRWANLANNQLEYTFNDIFEMCCDSTKEIFFWNLEFFSLKVGTLEELDRLTKNMVGKGN